MVLQSNNLDLDRCPHCQVAKPNLSSQATIETRDHHASNYRVWQIYVCKTCGGLVTTASQGGRDKVVREIYPKTSAVSNDIPDRARHYLQQAQDSIHAPSGAVMLAASAVDAMLKDKGLKKGSLYDRIDSAASKHLITEDVAKWAHDVRLDANDERHSDEDATFSTQEDASRCVDFAAALGEILYVLPARVRRGREEVSEGSDSA